MDWIKDVPKSVIFDPPVSMLDRMSRCMSGERMVQLTEDVWESLATYDTTKPTSPSAGRIYKRRFLIHGSYMPEKPENGYVFVVVNSPDGVGQLHVPYLAVITNRR